MIVGPVRQTTRRSVHSFLLVARCHGLRGLLTQTPSSASTTSFQDTSGYVTVVVDVSAKKISIVATVPDQLVACMGLHPVDCFPSVCDALVNFLYTDRFGADASM